MELMHENINNLISLWRSAAEPFQSYFDFGDYSYAYIENSQWPNRIWTKQLPNDALLSEITGRMRSVQPALSFSLFEEWQSLPPASLALQGLVQKSIQYGMSISPGKVFKEQGVISLRKVGGQEEISSWCRAFKASFGYEIDERTLEHTHAFIPYYSLLFNGQVGGTLMLYVTDDILGVHSLGVIPQLRGKGIARHAMHSTLNLALELGVKAVTLQASEMALPLYEQLGFSKQFAMKNYILKK